MITFEIFNTWTQIHNADEFILKVLDIETRYETDTAIALRRGFQNPEDQGWDGYVRLLRRPQTKPPYFPTGLTMHLKRICEKMNYPVNLIDRRERPVEGIPDYEEISLRDYQKKAVEIGYRVGRGVLDMVPRSGKTRTGCELVRRLAMPTLWIAPTDRIVQQTVKVLNGFFGEGYVAHLSHSGKQKECSGKMVVVCTAAMTATLEKSFLQTREVLIIDEFHHCFSPTTMVATDTNSRPIKDLCRGDLVWSCSPENMIQLKPVVNVWKRTAPTKMLRITTSVGVMEVTDEHKIWTPRGKVRAGDLREGSEIQVLQVQQGDQQERTLHSTRTFLSGCRYWKKNLSRLWRSIREEILWGTSSRVPEQVLITESQGSPGCYAQTFTEQGISRVPFQKNAWGSEPSKTERCSRENAERNQEGYQAWDGSLWSWKWGQGKGNELLRKVSILCTQTFGFFKRICGYYWETQRQWECNMVRSGFCSSRTKVGSGNRWKQPSKSEGSRRPKRFVAFGKWLGGNTHSFGQNTRSSAVVKGRVLKIEAITSPSSEVYDIEVADNHNYFAEGVLVSNSAAKTYRSLFKACDHIYFRFGMTGTFFRSGEDEMAMHGLLSNTIYQVTSKDLMGRGFLVPVRVIMVPVPAYPKLRGAGNQFQSGYGKFGIQEHEVRNQLATYAAWTLNKLGRKVLVLVGTKKQGNLLRSQLGQFLPKDPRAEFRQVEFLSTDIPRPVQNRIMDSYLNNEEVKVLIGTSLLGEGVDLPSCDALVYARGEKAEVSLTQNAYRVCTAVSGKKDAIIVDFCDRHHRRLVQHSVERAEVYYKEPIFSVEVVDDLQNLGSWLESAAPKSTQQIPV